MKYIASCRDCRKIKPTKAWAIHRGDGLILSTTVAREAKDAWDKLLGYADREWAKKRGYRLVRVIIKPTE